MGRINKSKVLSLVIRRNAFELFACIIIVAILAVGALKTYYPTEQKAKMTEVLNVFDVLKREVLPYYSYHGKMPNSADLPILDTYTKREVIFSMDISKIDVNYLSVLHTNNPYDFPIQVKDGHAPIDDFNFSNIDVRDGAITFTLKKDIFGPGNPKITFRPAYQEQYPSGTIIWLCGYQETPSNFFTTAKNYSSVNMAFLPPNCIGKI